MKFSPVLFATAMLLVNGESKFPETPKESNMNMSKDMN